MLTAFQVWFQNRKMQTKLMLGFSLVGVIIGIVGCLGVYGLFQVGQSLRMLYSDSTLALANLATSGSNLGLYHDKVLELARSRNKSEFALTAKSLAPLKNATVAPLQEYLRKGTLRTSRTGRDEAKDLVLLGDAANSYFRAAEGAVSALEDSHSELVPTDTRILMRDLGNLSVSTDVSSKYGAATQRLNEMVMTARQVAKDLNDNGQAIAEWLGNVMMVGSLMAIALGLALGFYLARMISRGVTHIADVATQAAHGQLRARAKIDSQDELGQMAVAFNMMLEATAI